MKTKQIVFRIPIDVHDAFRRRLLDEKIAAQSYLEAAVHLLNDKDKSTERLVVRASILHNEKMEAAHA